MVLLLSVYPFNREIDPFCYVRIYHIGIAFPGYLICKRHSVRTLGEDVCLKGNSVLNICLHKTCGVVDVYAAVCVGVPDEHRGSGGLYVKIKREALALFNGVINVSAKVSDRASVCF